jgi:hypothetical protein
MHLRRSTDGSSGHDRWSAGNHVNPLLMERDGEGSVFTCHHRSPHPSAAALPLLFATASASSSTAVVAWSIAVAWAWR